MMTLDELRVKWDHMDNRKENYLLVSGNHPISFHVGYAFTRQKSFVVYNIDRVEKLPSSKSIIVTTMDLNNGKHSLTFNLEDPTLEDVFTLLCWDLIDYSDDKNNALQKLFERFRKWQKLLKESKPDGLSDIKVKGLVGELLYLSKAIDSYGEDVAVHGWIGPDGADQDFVYMDKWVEIKTTTSDSSEIKISSLQQLDRNGEGYLVVYFMDQTSTEDPAACSLKSMVESVESKISSDFIRGQLWCKLAMRECFKPLLDKYVSTRFHLSCESTYCLDSDFPKLTRNNIPIGINNASYTLSLPVIDKFIKK